MARDLSYRRRSLQKSNAVASRAATNCSTGQKNKKEKKERTSPEMASWIRRMKRRRGRRKQTWMEIGEREDTQEEATEQGEKEKRNKAWRRGRL